MRQRYISQVVVILILTAILIWIDQPNSPGIHIKLGDFEIDRDVSIHQGLDLQGGLQVLLEADVPPDQEGEFDARTMEAARVVVENRVNGLGVTEPQVQLQGEDRIIVELPGIDDPDQAIATLRETGLLEFVEAGRNPLLAGQLIRTNLAEEEGQLVTTGVLTEEYAYDGQVFPTLMTGRHLKDADVSTDNMGSIVIAFELTDEGAEIFRDYTLKHSGEIVAIVLDKRVLSAPVIEEPITDGSGIIRSGQSGGFPLEEARSVAIQMKYGALPVPLQVVENRTVGPTLGKDSVQRSIQAGAIGLTVVLLFMLAYYRLPGFMADLALIIYALINFALYKVIPVTLTLPAITGFILSTGMAVDANILVFERMKEEVRAGRSLRAAMETAFKRAWPSIRDSNLSTLLTCIILFWFGSNFGASIVKGFAITLALGVIVNLFTAIVVTRTFLRFLFDIAEDKLRDHPWLLGI